MVEVPTFCRVADVCCVQQQGQGFGLVNAAKESRSTILKTEVSKTVPLISCVVFLNGPAHSLIIESCFKVSRKVCAIKVTRDLRLGLD